MNIKNVIPLLALVAVPAVADVEIEPNNYSTAANDLKILATGQTQINHDVDFFKITNELSQEVPILFSCTQAAKTDSEVGWFLTAWDEQGNMQADYLVLPKYCKDEPYQIVLSNSNISYVSVESSLETNIPSFTADFFTGGVWTSTDWTGDEITGWVHSPGTISGLSYSNEAVVNTKYQVTYTVTSTAGSLTIGFGGQSKAGITDSGTFGMTAIKAEKLAITPTTDFDGSIVISITAIDGPIGATNTSSIKRPTTTDTALKFTANTSIYNILIGGVYTGDLYKGKIVDSLYYAKDTVSLKLNDCGNSSATFTITGNKLNLISLVATDMPIKIQIGGFECRTKATFVTTAKGSAITYSKTPPKPPTTTTPTTTPTTNTTTTTTTTTTPSKNLLGTGK